MANADRGRKLFIRSVLATSATIATFAGAQSLAMLDMRQYEAQAVPAADSSAVTTTTTNNVVLTTPVPTVSSASAEPQIQVAAPSIVILRGSQNVAQSGTTNQTVSAVPTVTFTQSSPTVMPAPALAPPQPVIVQQPVRQSSRSTR
jgi:hypothetical protein